jgi:hypothetical protein
MPQRRGRRRPVSISTSSSSPFVRTATTRPSSSLPNQRVPSTQSGPPVSASAGATGCVRGRRTGARSRGSSGRRVVGVQRGRRRRSTRAGVVRCPTGDGGPSTTIRLRAVRPAARIDPTACRGGSTRSTRCGGRSARQRGLARKSLSSTIEVTPEPSRAMRTIARRGAPDRLVGLADREQLAVLPGEPAEAHAAVGGVSMRGGARLDRPDAPGRSSRRRAGCRHPWLVHDPPPYSCTRERAFNGAGSTSTTVPSAPRRRTAVRPSFLGHASRPTTRHRRRTAHRRCAGSPLSHRRRERATATSPNARVSLMDQPYSATADRAGGCVRARAASRGSVS